jgi:uronate dehydrogenase
MQRRNQVVSKRKTLLVTGAAGTVGSSLCVFLRERYRLRLLFHETIPRDVNPDDEIMISAIECFPAMVKAAEGVDVVVHLAVANLGLSTGPSGVTYAEQVRTTIDVDMKGTYHVFEAARLNKVAAVVYASTNHVTGMNEKEGKRSHPDMPLRPDSIYGVGKAFGEALGRYYADCYGLRVYCLRIANFNGQDDPGRVYAPGQSRWLSPRDLAQLTCRCIEAKDLNWGIFYGVSRGGEEKWDLSNARALLGYRPQDDGSAVAYRRDSQR